VVFGDIAVMRDIFWPGKADPRGNPATGLVGLGPCQYAKRYLSGTQRGDAGTARGQFAMRWQDRGNRNKVLLLDIGVTQSMLECGKVLAMPTCATR